MFHDINISLTHFIQFHIVSAAGAKDGVESLRLFTIVQLNGHLLCIPINVITQNRYLNADSLWLIRGLSYGGDV